METFVLTEEMMRNAKTYMPMAVKMKLSDEISELCVKIEDKEKSGDIYALPPLKTEQEALKIMMLQNTLLGFYFDIEVDEKKDAFEVYDHYAGSHILNQIERYKQNAEIRTKAFDLLSDFRDFRRMVDARIERILYSENNALDRLLAGMALASDPEYIKNELNELKKVGGGYTEELSQKGILPKNEEAVNNENAEH